MVDLPCVVESCKTLDNKTFFKTGNVCQVRGGGRGGEVVGGEGRGGGGMGLEGRGGGGMGLEGRGGAVSSCLCWCTDAGVFGGGE